MVMKKSQFKALIKECLKEILAEGLGNTQLVEGRSTNRVLESVTTNRAPVRQPHQQYHPGLDEPRQSAAPMPQQNHAKSLVENSISRLTNDPAMSRLTNDPAMASIFADTAASTYAKQPQSVMGGGAIQKNVPATDIPLDALAGALGGMNPSSWESLAFTDSKKLK
jgi:hypothetical protein